MRDEFFMQQALLLAQRAENEDEVPVGAVLVRDDEMIAEGYNKPIQCSDPTAHTEIVALRDAAARLGNYRLINTTLYVTLEPCAMCVGAMLHARVKRLVFGAVDPKAGAVQSVLQLLDDTRFNHTVQWQGGVLENDCSAALKAFFQKRRV